MKRIVISGVFVLLGLAVLAQPIGSGTLEARMILGGVQSMKQYRTFTMDKGWEIQTYLAEE